MYKIVICIPTFKRPEMLRNLVLSILECNIDKSLIISRSIVIVDNDAEKSAEKTVAELVAREGKGTEISYSGYPVKGLANVRNELLRIGLAKDPDFIVFVDDDEYVTMDWLNELVGTIESNKGDMAMGPVNSVVGNHVPVNISCWLDRADYFNNAKLNFIRTGNLIISVKSLLEKNVWFDSRFNKTGGEDSFFGLQMIKKGATIYWASKAVVCETVPDERANLKWLFARYYNGANKFAFILKIERNKVKIAKKIVVSLIYILTGFFGLVLILFPIKKKYRGLLKLSEGLGGIAGFLSLRYNAY
jgi:glycosyltransferase involved in cell wall biosynthesis